MTNKKCRHCEQKIERHPQSETGWIHLVTDEIKCTVTPKAEPLPSEGNKES